MMLLAASSPPPLRLKERWLALRDRLLSNARFLQRASGLPIVNRIARRRARALFDLCAGFVYSQVLAACVRLDIAERVGEAPQTAASLAQALGLETAALTQLLDAAVALDLLEHRGAGRFGLGPLGAALRANPGIGAMVKHHAMFYDDLRDPVALLRAAPGETQLHRYWSYVGHSQPSQLAASEVAAYSALMASSATMVAHEVVDAYPIEDYRCLLDVGGGEGVFLLAAAERAPRLKLMLFDLPPVAERARLRLAAAGRSQQATVTGGDFLQDALPRGADIATLIRVLHDHNDDGVLAILRAVRAALPDNGVLLIAEPMSGIKGTAPVADAYFTFYLRAMGRGQARSFERFQALLYQAGFGYVRLLPTRLPLNTQLLMASPKGRCSA